VQPGEKFVRCLLDRNDEESQRARRLRRRTLLISILIQAVILTLLLLRPLFGAEEIRLIARFLPLPPYRGGSPGPPTPPHRPTHPPSRPTPPAPHSFVFVPRPAHPSSAVDETPPEIGAAHAGLSVGDGPGDPNGLIPIPGMAGGSRPLPPPPPPGEAGKRGPIRKPSEVQEALLIDRVEPKYPPLARQIHLQGTVEIHAIIATDGTIQSAEILSGNAILARAALDAVLRWRYQPTLLNGRPVEVETTIRVIFRIP
jgi:periplasmic protein TonB